MFSLALLVYNISIVQNEWSVELGPGVNLAAKDLRDTDLKTGLGFDAAVGYRFMGHLGAYVGLGRNQFK